MTFLFALAGLRLLFVTSLRIALGSCFGRLTLLLALRALRLLAFSLFAALKPVFFLLGGV
jgi:hypothetical protein